MPPDPIDLMPQGDPETVVMLPGGSLLGLRIRHSGFGEITLGIREDAEGYPVSCAVTNDIRIEFPPQSNPRRQDDAA